MKILEDLTLSYTKFTASQSSCVNRCSDSRALPPVDSGMSTPQARNRAALPFRRPSFDADGENQMSTSDRAPLFPQDPAYPQDADQGAFSIR